ncbi:MAG TPA: hypothetical protein VG271_08830, partial [Beijerinckiaceae bacterium]|nr:hypothetical protein [Beijerinckiaceae bacterium]
TEATMSSEPATEHEAPAPPVAADAQENGADFEEADHINIEAAPPQPSEPDLVSLSEPIALAAAEPEAPAEPQENDSAVAPASPAIIGRYESNGASYVLYADGTIDATTQSGVFHFASMAELKVFIENKT